MCGIKRIQTAFALAGLMAFTAACSGPEASPDAGLIRQAKDIFGALPAVMASPDNPVTPEKVALGRALFYENRISVDGTVSCARCHPFSLYAADGLPKSTGNRCRTNPRNAPTILNAAAQIAAHWVGNRTGVEDQARQSLLGAASFGLPSNEAAESRLKGIPGYLALFQEAFPGQAEPITVANFALAVGAFERTLVTPAPFDDFLRGNAGSLGEAQKQGLREFIGTGCTTCHAGAFVGGQSFQRFGIHAPYWEHTHSPEIDPGRFDVTKAEADRYVFKVPVLRNVQMTAPYFHDGSVSALSEAVRIMGRVQLGTDIAGDRLQAIVQFLGSLTGRLPAEAGEVPVLPAGESAGAAGPPAEADAGLSPNEDLMQEHALLSRILLIYEEVVRRLEGGDGPDPGILAQSAQTVRHFVEDYHEKLEETHVFPRFGKDGPLAGLVDILLEQHRAGRALTERIIGRSTAAAFKDPAGRRQLVEDLRAFIRMYRPHAAREGSVLFPAFRELVPAAEFLKLGETFEAQEHQVLGAEGFEGQVARIAGLEKRLGIGELSRFTPAGKGQT